MYGIQFYKHIVTVLYKLRGNNYNNYIVSLNNYHFNENNQIPN